jgi:hypothetical protein
MDTVFVTAKLAPDRVRAGESVEFVIRLRVGRGYTPNPSRIIFDFPAPLGMSRPSLLHREDSGFVEVYVSNPDVAYTKRIWDVELGDFAGIAQGSWRGMAQRMFVLDLAAGLRADDTIEIHWGDTGDGSGAGTQVTTITPAPGYAAVIHVRYFDSQSKGLPDWGRSFQGYDRPAPDCQVSLAFRVEPRELDHLRVIRQVNRASLIPLDVFGNVAAVEQATDVAEAGEPACRNAFGVFEFADKNVLVRAKRHPVADAPAMGDVFDGLNLYWGDAHTHSTFSRDCIEREKQSMLPADLMRFARDRACLDFLAVTDHQKPGGDERHKIGASNWALTLDAIRECDCPGRFLVFPGFEYQCVRGDTVILCNWLAEYEDISDPGWNDVRDVWEAWSGRDYLSIAHLHNPGKLAPDEWWEHPDARIAPVMEIFSCHGSYERADVLENKPALIKTLRPDRCGAYFLRRGFHYGFTCNSDGHKGHVGLGGLTAVFAPALDKAFILEAYRRRHVYGTTNARIRLVFAANGQLMGSILKYTPAKQFLISVRGENRLKRIDLFRNAELYQRFYPDGAEFQRELTVFDDAPSNWYVRVTQVDNHQAFSSPIWFEP